MGWDAFATFEGSENRLVELPAYVEAADRIKADRLTVDGLLRYGGLDVTACAYMLQCAARAGGVQLDCWGPALTAHQVRELAEKCDWSFVATEDAEWAKRSAQAFLETAAAQGHGIRFSW